MTESGFKAVRAVCWLIFALAFLLALAYSDYQTRDNQAKIQLERIKLEQIKEQNKNAKNS